MRRAYAVVHAVLGEVSPSPTLDLSVIPPPTIGGGLSK